MLSPLDDYLVHQVPEPVAHVGTSDRNFFDRYYFSCHDLEGDLFLVLAMGQYPNLGVTDAFVSVVHEGKQQVVRASRELGADRMNTQVGPLGVEVVEPMRSLRLFCEANEWGLEFDVTFHGVVEPYLEPRFFRRTGVRVTQDYLRTTQTGRYDGWIKIGEKRLELTREKYWGSRDHSWGVRGVGDPEPPGYRPAGGGTFFWNWSCIQTPEYTILYTVSEEADGTRWNDSTVRLWPIGSGRAPEHLKAEHNIEFISRTRQFRRASLTMTEEDGRRFTVECQPLTVLWMSGCGYGADWRHGMYHGPLEVQGLSHDLKDPETLRRLAGLHETVCRYDVDGQVGYGVFELIALGPYPRYGFNTPRDVAP